MVNGQGAQDSSRSLPPSAVSSTASAMNPFERTSRPLTKRPRASIACNSCRQSKSKCDGKTPTCERCRRLLLTCVYTESGRDKRLDRRNEQRTSSDLRNRVRELEAKLAAVTGTPPARSPSASHEGQQGSDAGRSAVGVGGRTFQQGSGSDNVLLSANSEDTSRAASQSNETRVDVLAAGVFDHPSSAGYMCHFGSSSNHAVFWSLTASIANLGHRSSHLYQELRRPGPSSRGPPPTQLPIPPSSSVRTHPSADPDQTLMPERSTAVRWISRFFDTVGATLPYVTEPALLAGLEKIQTTLLDSDPSTRALRPLLSIVFAHALSTLDDEGSPEPFYRLTLQLLEPKKTYVSSVELLQTLMLLGIYQQNSQRSTESLTTHALAVKTSYHLGVHSTFLYDFVGPREKETRARLWFAVVNQDRMLSTALGQPCLIAPQHVRDDIIDFLDMPVQNRTVEMSHSAENLDYFRNIISLHEHMAAALEAIYDSNISTSTRPSLEDLTSKTLHLSLRLENWLLANIPGGLIDTSVDFSTWNPASFDAERNWILSSIFYYRTSLLIHGPLLMHVLELATRGSADVSSIIVRDSILSLLRAGFSAVIGFHHLIRAIVQYNRPFLKNNAVWWTCNYAALTLCLHMFAFWIASKSPQASFIALWMGTAELESHLQDFLDTLKAIGVASAMSVKAHRCLHRHLSVLSSVDSMSSINTKPSQQLPPEVNQPGEGGNLAQPNPEQEAAAYNVAADFLGNIPSEWLGNFDFQDLFNADSFGMELGVSDFDATGLI